MCDSEKKSYTKIFLTKGQVHKGLNTGPENQNCITHGITTPRTSLKCRIYEPRQEKTVFGVFDQVGLKAANSATESSWSLEKFGSILF